MSGPGAPCVGARRSLRRGPALSRDSLCRGTVLSVESSQDFIFRYRRSACRSVYRSVCRGPALFVSEPGALSIAARRSLYRGALCVGSGALSVAARRSLCRARHAALSIGLWRVWSPDCSCIGARLFSSLCVVAQRRRSLCRGPAFFCRGSVFFGSEPCVGARRSLSGTAFQSNPRRGVSIPIRVPPNSQPRAIQPATPIRVPPIQPNAFPFSRREPQTLLFGGKNLKYSNILYSFLYENSYHTNELRRIFYSN